MPTPAPAFKIQIESNLHLVDHLVQWYHVAGNYATMIIAVLNGTEALSKHFKTSSFVYESPERLFCSSWCFVNDNYEQNDDDELHPEKHYKLCNSFF